MSTQPEVFCGRTDELTQVLELVGADNAQPVSIVGDPGFGRSAFLRELARVGESTMPAVFVLLSLRGTEDGPTGFYLLLGSALEQACNTPRATVPELVLKEAIAAIRSSGRRLILLCDDFHHLTRDPAYPPSFFEALRALASTEDLFAIVTSSFLPLNQMCSSVELAGSPFFNIFSTRRLGPLKHDEADALLERLGPPSGGPPVDDGLKIAVWDLTGGCPYLVRLAADHLLDPGVPPSTSGDPAWERALSVFLDQSEAYYTRIWELLSQRERQLCLATTKEQISQVPVGLVARGLLARRGRGKACVPNCFAFKRFLVRKQGGDVRFVHPRRRGWLASFLGGWRGTKRDGGP